MSKKSTKIIAVAGVVAGLGVAALPAMTFAAESASGAVKLQAQVLPSIAMTIHSNGDASGTNYYAENPTGAGAGYGVDSDTLYTKSEGLFTNWSSATTSLLPNATSEAMTSTVTVYTNASGYTLSVIDEDTDNSLKLDASNSIAAFASPAATLVGGTAGWGIKGGDLTTAYNGIPASDGTALTLKANGTASGSGDATTFTYGVATSATQKVGTYEDVIVYTATTK